ncbi:MAG: GNAT family N-acetyltransferase [Chloroflexi bacterium]|nr:GNAT family N-acetyltransferase [Chloroflexota bacterium]
MPEPTFRTATEDDVPAVAVVAETLWDDMGAASGFLQQPTAEGLGLIVAGEASRIFVCQTDAGIDGFSVLSRDADDAETAVMGVWLLPGARGKGTGRELALMATEFARESGYKKLRGTLPPDNEGALSFFSEIATLAQVVGEGMEYELPL